MTTRWRTGVQRWAFGSTAERVLRSGQCPLIVQRTPAVAAAQRAA
jgi:nucleotide-binding universal stress UspA family protein